MKRFFALILVLLLALGQPVRAASSDCCASQAMQVAMHSEMNCGAMSGISHHAHKTDFAGLACQALCGNVAALSQPVCGRWLPSLFAVEFFPARLLAIDRLDERPEPFPPRTDILG